MTPVSLRGAQSDSSPGIREKNCESGGPKPKEEQRGPLSRKVTWRSPGTVVACSQTYNLFPAVNAPGLLCLLRRSSSYPPAV
jgi:hypothetical protein